MKIILINNLYGSLARGGAEKLVKLQAEALARRGHTVTVLATRPPGKYKISPQGYGVKLFFPWNIISYYHLNKLPAPLRLIWHAVDMFNVHSYFKIKSIIKRERPDVVITHNLKGVGFLTPRAIKRAGVKHIHTLHDIQLLHPSGLMYVGAEKKVDGLFARAYQWVNKKLFATVDVVVSPSQWLLDEHVRRGFFTNAARQVLRNPTSNVAAVHPPAQNTQPEFVFAYAGQMEHHKGVQVLLQAFERLRAKGIRATLRLIGDGSRTETLRRQAEPLGSAVTFLPWDHDRAAEEIARADCLVVPSVCYENYPTIIVEAQACGTPVVASNIGGIPELLHNGGGTLFSAGDAQALAAAMRRAAAGEVRWGSERAYNLQTIDSYVENLLQLC